MSEVSQNPPISGPTAPNGKKTRKRASEEVVGVDRCFKCRSGKSFTASRDGPKKPYCKECMSTYLEKLVRDGFFRSCGVPANTKVAICCSGGANSLMLLNVLGMIAQENKKRGGEGKIVFDLHVLLLDERGVIQGDQYFAKNQGGEDAVAQLRMERVAAVAQKWDLPLLLLEGNRISTPQQDLGFPMKDFLSREMIGAINGGLPLSDREELYLLSRQRCLVEAAAGFGCHGIITGENAVVAATRALAALVRGRGAHVGDEAGFRGHGFSQNRKGESQHLTVYRPLRTVLPKEAIFYNLAQSLPQGLYHAAPCSGTSLRSLNRSLEAFMTNLMISFRSTVFNVLTAVEKMHSALPGGDPFQALVGSASGGIVVASSKSRNATTKGEKKKDPLEVPAAAAAAVVVAYSSPVLSNAACGWCGLSIEIELDPTRLADADDGAPCPLTTSFKIKPSFTEGPKSVATGTNNNSPTSSDHFLCYGCRKLEHGLPAAIHQAIPAFETANMQSVFPPFEGEEGDACPTCQPEEIRAMTDAEKKEAIAEFLLDDTE